MNALIEFSLYCLNSDETECMHCHIIQINNRYIGTTHDIKVSASDFKSIIEKLRDYLPFKVTKYIIR